MLLRPVAVLMVLGAGVMRMSRPCGVVAVWMLRPLLMLGPSTLRGTRRRRVQGLSLARTLTHRRRRRRRLMTLVVVIPAHAHSATHWRRRRRRPSWCMGAAVVR